MIIESVIILAILLLIIYIYRRRGRVAIPSLILPFAILPAVEIVSFTFYNISSFFNLWVLCGVYLAALAVASTMLGFLASKITTKSFRSAYIGVWSLYFVVYTVLFVMYAYNKYLHGLV